MNDIQKVYLKKITTKEYLKITRPRTKAMFYFSSTPYPFHSLSWAHTLGSLKSPWASGSQFFWKKNSCIRIGWFQLQTTEAPGPTALQDESRGRGSLAGNVIKDPVSFHLFTLSQCFILILPHPHPCRDHRVVTPCATLFATNGRWRVCPWQAVNKFLFSLMGPSWANPYSQGDAGVDWVRPGLPESVSVGRWGYHSESSLAGEARNVYFRPLVIWWNLSLWVKFRIRFWRGTPSPLKTVIL